MKLKNFLLLIIVLGMIQVSARKLEYRKQTNQRKSNMEKTDISQQLKDDYKKVR